MKKNIRKMALVNFNIALCTTLLFSQAIQKSLISFDNGEVVLAIDNSFHVVAQQTQHVSINQMSATIKYPSGSRVPLEIETQTGHFTIHPDSLGVVEFTIRLKDTIEHHAFRVVPIKVVGALSRYKANEVIKISAGEFKAQRGIVAYVDCCGFDAKCTVLSYEVLRIGALNTVERSKNVGAKFDQNTRNIVDRTVSGDLYVFRKIYSTCSPAMKPQRLEDMTFEIE